MGPPGLVLSGIHVDPAGDPQPLVLTGARIDRGGRLRPRRGDRLRHWLAVSAIVVGTVVVATIVLDAVGTESLHKGEPRGPGTRVVQRLILSAPGAQPEASGTGVIVRHGGSLVLLLRAHGLAANTTDVYAVWLQGQQGPALLGFVSPPVGRTGSFSSGTLLPADAARFQTLLITRETTTEPIRPGQPILAAHLSLH